jgi:hypothetical protein
MIKEIEKNKKFLYIIYHILLNILYFYCVTIVDQCFSKWYYFNFFE